MRAHPYGWVKALHPGDSPCRHDASLGKRQHRCSREHAELVEGCRSWRESAELAAEAATNGYATELRDYWQENTRPTFRAYLMHR